MFGRKEKREILEKMQNCLEGIHENNIALTNAVGCIAENQKQLSNGMSAMHTNNVALANVVSELAENQNKISAGLIDNENKIAENLSEVQSNNQALSEALDDVLSSNKTAITDMVKSREQMKNIIDGVQSNNLILANTLKSVIERDSSKSKELAEKQYTEDEKWKAAYALNLCTVSISQIIEYNDLRFMDKEYDNILNNLNLEMMPKDEALLDVLKQILDVITFFKIQDKERQLLEKEYQQKMKDAIWSAAPNPSVIMSGGSGGWVGLAVTAAISVGTGYMNYRKEKAKIGLEQERKEWELERSLMEQLHGLRRQLFETSWRLADEYKFSDDLRLTERQIKQFNEILQDDDSLRQYYRLEYVEDQYQAYPQFLYYLGSAALNIAKKYEYDANISTQYLEKANSHFDEFFEKSKIQNKLLREDPIVAQCAFEYIATIELKDKKKLLTIDENEKRRLIGEKLDSAVKFSGNSLDVLQMCALNYLASDRANEAIRILKMLVNEYYNVSSNAQLLSMLYVKSHSVGNCDADAEYRLLIKTCPYKIELYPMPKGKDVDFKELDSVFCAKQKRHLAERYLKAMEAFVGQSEKAFNNIWSRDYDISNDIISYFEDFTDAVKVMCGNSGVNTVHNNLTRAFDKIKSKTNLDILFSDVSLRAEYKFDMFVKDTVENIVSDFLEKLRCANECKSLSKLETEFLNFCNKYSLLSDKNEIIVDQNNQASIESILTGKSIAQLKHENMRFEKLMTAIKNSNLNGQIVPSNSKEVECFYHGTQKCEEYIDEYKLPLKGRVLAVIVDKKATMWRYQDIVFTTDGMYVISRRSNETIKTVCEIQNYEDVKVNKTNTALEHDEEEVYNQDSKEIDYAALSDLIYNLKKIVDNYNSQDVSSELCKAIMAEVKKKCNNLLKSITASSEKKISSSDRVVKNSSEPSIKDGYAEVTYVTDPLGCVGVLVKIHKGMFSVGDNIIIVNRDGTECSDTIIRINSKGQLVDQVEKGDSATFIFQNVSKNDIAMGATIGHC